MAGNNLPVDPEGKGIGSLVGKVLKRATPVLRIGSSLWDALPQEIKDKAKDSLTDSIFPQPGQQTVGPSSFSPILTDEDFVAEWKIVKGNNNAQNASDSVLFNNTPPGPTIFEIMRNKGFKTKQIDSNSHTIVKKRR